MSPISASSSSQCGRTPEDDECRGPDRARLSPSVAGLGLVSLLMGMSSAMIYGLLPLFLVTIVGAGVASADLIEGIAEATTSLIKIFSGGGQ